MIGKIMTTTELGNARDILEVAVQNGTEYYASWYNGIPEMKDGELITKHGYANTNGVLDTTYYFHNRIRISDLKFDKEGNLWGLSSEVNHPLFVKTKKMENGIHLQCIKAKWLYFLMIY